MLWEKDPKNSTLYTNIFAPKSLKKKQSDIKSTIGGPLPVKNDAISLEKRKLGNELFAKYEWLAAMEKYNDSLRFAKPGSENISLAYANRSTCFFKMQLYDECLVDIELAKAAGYPERLMPKLDRREAECLKSLEESEKHDGFGSKLSFDADEKIPSMANVVTIEKSAEGECWAYAKEDIGIGKTIVFEKALTAGLYERFGWKCNICMNGKANLVPCTKCPQAMFCSKECQECFIHDYECGRSINNNDELDGPLKNMVRLSFMLIRMFPNFDELIGFVEQTRKSDPNDIPEALTDDKSKYQVYIKMPFTSKPNESHLLPSFIAYDGILNHPMVKPLIQSEKHRRFLMHLTLMHGLLPMQEEPYKPESLYDAYTYELGKVMYSQTGIMKKFIDHSCSPNLQFLPNQGKYIYNTIRPVKKGEQLTYGFLGVLMEPTAQRQRAILDHEKLTCKCVRCKFPNGEGKGPAKEERRRMASDPDYLKVKAFRPWSDENDKAKVKALYESCETFLNKYSQVKWCDEIAHVVNTLAKILSKRMERGSIAAC